VYRGRLAGNLAPAVANTPAFVYSSERIVAGCRSLRAGLAASSARVLYATKACGLEAVIKILNQFVDGFAVASPSEARLVFGFISGSRNLHITTPGFKKEWFDEPLGLTHVAFNSTSQFDRLQKAAPSSISLGIRVNPGLSRVEDERYNPCRRYSKLGVPLVELVNWLDGQGPQRLEGLHFHNACLCESWISLRDTVARITSHLDSVLAGMKWINLGGGFVWDETTDFAPLQETVNMLTTNYGLAVFIEPGAGFVNSAGYLVASVTDLFKSDEKTIAVLDTTVNHLPEVFEYQFEPDVAGNVDNGRHQYILAGCSCLAGDLFGEYAFDEPLEIGSRITFENVGAYTIVKANMFNGINLPSIYTSDQTGRLRLIKEFNFDDFAGRFAFQLNEYASS
jgi:carboxynorspermidine decarboxylase